MGVGMPGIEVVDGNPIETRIEIVFHLRNQIADERLQIGDAIAILGRHDEAELMRVVLRAAEEGGYVSMVIASRVKFSGLAVAGDAIAQDVMEMRTSGPEIAGFDDRVTRLNDDTAAAWGDQSIGGAQAGARSATRLEVTILAQGARTRAPGNAKRLGAMALQTATTGIADPAEFEFQIVVRHWRSSIVG
jgi:hypothetical protein